MGVVVADRKIENEMSQPKKVKITLILVKISTSIDLKKSPDLYESENKKSLAKNLQKWELDSKRHHQDIK